MISRENSSNGKVSVEFRVKGELSTGQSLFVSGNGEELGNWDITRAIELNTTSLKYPIWSSDMVQFPQDQKIQYKYLIFQGGFFLKWEGRLTNRIVDVGYDNCRTHDTLNESSQEPVIVDFLPIQKSFSEVRSSRVSNLNVIERNNPIVYISFYLPIFIEKKDGDFNIILDDTNQFLLNSRFYKFSEIKWVGYLRNYHTFTNEEIIKITGILNSQYDMFFPKIDMPPEIHQYCNHYLSPLLHNISIVYTDYANIIFPENIERQFVLFHEMNLNLSNLLLDLVHDTTIINIISYQLILLPFHVRRKLKDIVIINFIFDVPWPSSDLTDQLLHRNEFFSSLSNCNLISFLTYGHGRHYTNYIHRHLKVKILKLPRFIEVNDNGNKYPISCGSIPIHSDFYEDYLLNRYIIGNDTINNQLRQSVKGRYVFSSILSSMDYVSVSYIFESIENLLIKVPSLLNKVFFIMYVVIQSDNEEVCSTKIIAKINSYTQKYSRLFLVKYSEFFTLNERIYMFNIANCYISYNVTHLLNIYPDEFIFINNLLNHNDRTLIISELTISSRLLNGSFRFNPYNTESLSYILHYVVNMCQDEIIMRFNRNFEAITDNQFSGYLAFLDYLVGLYSYEPSLNIIKMGFGMKIRSFVFDPSFTKLDTTKLLTEYTSCHHKVIIADYGGTCINVNIDNDSNNNNSETHEILQNLASSDVQFVLVSGRIRNELDSIFSDYPDVIIAAEHGYWFRDKRSTEWIPVFPICDMTFAKIAKPIMKAYEERTNSSFFEEKGLSLVWNYRDSDYDFGPLQAKELCEILRQSMIGYDAGIILTETYVEVKPKCVSKGEFFDYYLDYYTEQNKCAPDFLLVIGDDETDEELYQKANIYSLNRCDPNLICYTVTVGKKESEASHYFDCVEEVVSLFRNLSKHAKRKESFRSLSILDDTHIPSFDQIDPSYRNSNNHMCTSTNNDDTCPEF